MCICYLIVISSRGVQEHHYLVLVLFLFFLFISPINPASANHRNNVLTSISTPDDFLNLARRTDDYNCLKMVSFYAAVVVAKEKFKFFGCPFLMQYTFFLLASTLVVL